MKHVVICCQSDFVLPSANFYVTLSAILCDKVPRALGRYIAGILTAVKCTLLVLQSPDGKYLASGAIDGIINIFDIATGKLLHTLEGNELCICII